uniref:DNA breaking-rejoining enzyme n=1 Tax=Mycena chlorophos TaxID=658473 RepID=A0ABQ0LKB3_MYCCL|nr:DNA breaking-rejoining enzyme [Mycena chlorophos]
MVAIEFGLRLAVERGFTDTHFHIRSDNQGVIGALDSGKSRNSEQNRVLRRIVSLLRTHSLWISTTYVPSAENLADAPSRGFPPSDPTLSYATASVSDQSIDLTFDTSAPSVLLTLMGVAKARPQRKAHPLPASSPSNKLPRIFHTSPDISRRDPVRLSASAKQQLDRAFQHGWQPSTLENYGYAVDRFHRYCDRESIPKQLRLPAHDFVLCAFAASHAGIHAHSTAQNDIAALKAWHIAQGQTWRASPRLHYVLNGVKNLAPDSSQRPPRPPITVDMLSALGDGLDFSSRFDVAVFAAACTAFWGQCRLGEILPESNSAANLRNKPMRSHFRPKGRNRAVLRLPRTKTHTSGDDVVLTRQQHSLDPRKAIQMHLVSIALESSAPLFAYGSNGAWRALTRNAFLNRCNAIWANAGYPRHTGHSFRIGGTTELLLRGVPSRIVKAMGRWKSDAFLRYWRALEDIVPRYA